MPEQNVKVEFGYGESFSVLSRKPVLGSEHIFDMLKFS
jgi:hypothetical protein